MINTPVPYPANRVSLVVDETPAEENVLPTVPREITLRFLAAPTDAGYSGNVGGGRVLQWIDQAGYACAVGWSGRYCVTAYVGNVKFSRPLGVGHLVEAAARLVHTGRSRMHILVTVRSCDPKDGMLGPATEWVRAVRRSASHRQTRVLPAQATQSILTSRYFDGKTLEHRTVDAFPERQP